jgi:ferredoxin-NADP reductase|tara:strand:- start:32778 stop:33479 length:702 start_codon:yes stop_codon:yes gene_type:complete
MERKKIHNFKTKILKIENLAEDVKHLVLSVPEGFDFHPGQFISLLINRGDTQLRRPYSIASKPGKNEIDLCIKILPEGLITPIIDRMGVGQEIDAIGPMGHFYIQEESMNKPITFIATGAGITPFRSAIHHLLEKGFKSPITLIAGYRYEKNSLYDEEFKELEEKYPNFTYKKAISRPEEGDKNYVQDILKQNITPNTHYYICGLKEMVFAVRDLLIEQENIPKENVFFEKYD